MTTNDKSARAVKELGYQLGFDLVGITTTDPMSEAGQRLRQAIESGRTAEMDYLQRSPEKRADPKANFPWASSIISVGICYHYVPVCTHSVPIMYQLCTNSDRFVPFCTTKNPISTSRPPLSHSAAGTEDCQTPQPSSSPNAHQPLISRYAQSRDYHLVLKEKLRLFRDGLREVLNRDFHNRIAVDTLPIMEKPLAQRAGLGWQGKNSLLINPKFGSWIFLGELITDLELTPDQPMTNRCGDCQLCIDACPTGALSEPGQLDATKCLSYLTVEHKGEIPPAIIKTIQAHSNPPDQPQSHKATTANSKKDTQPQGPKPQGKSAAQATTANGNSAVQSQSSTTQCAVYGCDICQTACPFNRDVPGTKEPQFYPRDEILNLTFDDLRNINEAQFKKLFSDTPLARLTYQQFLRNIKLLKKI